MEVSKVKHFDYYSNYNNEVLPVDTLFPIVEIFLLDCSFGSWVWKQAEEQN